MPSSEATLLYDGLDDFRLPWVAGSFFGLIATGAILSLGIAYYQSPSHKTEKLWVRIFIPYLLGMTFIATVSYLIDTARNGFENRTGSPSMKVSTTVEAIILSSTQLFALVRSTLFVRSLAGRLSYTRAVMSIVVALVICCTLVAGHIAAYFNGARVSNSAFRRRDAAATSWIVGCSVVDIYLTLSVSIDFIRTQPGRSEVKSTADQVVWKLIVLTLRNGAVLTAMQTMLLFLFLFHHEAWLICASDITPKVSTITVFLYLSTPRSTHRRLVAKDEERQQRLYLDPTLPSDQLVASPPCLPPSSSSTSRCSCRASSQSVDGERRKDRKGPVTTGNEEEKGLVVLPDGGDGTRHMGILKEISASVTVEVDERREEFSHAGESWEERRLRLDIGNRCVIESPASPVASPIARFFTLNASSPPLQRTPSRPSLPPTPSRPTHPLRSSSYPIPDTSSSNPSLASLPSAAFPLTLPSPSSTPARDRLPSPNGPGPESFPPSRPTITSRSSNLFSLFRLSSAPPARNQTGRARQADGSEPPLAFISSFPDGIHTTTSQGTYDPEQDDFEFAEMFGLEKGGKASVGVTRRRSHQTGAD